MRDPDSQLFQKWTELSMSGQMFGQNRPVGRITIAKNQVKSVRSNRPGPWRYILFQGGSNEMYGVQSITIDRSLGQDAATCTLVMTNDYMQHYAYSPQGIDTGIGRPGYYTFNRGDVSPIKKRSVYNDMVGGRSVIKRHRKFEHDPVTGERISPFDPVSEDFPTEWGYPRPGTGDNPDAYYYDLLIPNRVIRTYQGYGSDNFDENGNERSVHEEGYVRPDHDTQLVQTGVWMVDKVVYSSNGTIQVTMRDVAKVMLEQIVYPPMIPIDRFPLVYCPEKPATGEKGGISQNLAAGISGSSNDCRKGFNAKYYGHRPSDAFDGHAGSFFLSTGNSVPNSGFSYEYVQTRVNNMDCNQVRVHTVGGGYVCFISVMENGVWQGSETVPYDPQNINSFPNGANIRYVKRVVLGTEGPTIIELPRTYKAQHVRVCMTNLVRFPQYSFPYRVVVRELEVRYNKPDTYVASTVGVPGHISDWSEAVKELAGWAGLTYLTDHHVTTGVVSPTSLTADKLLGTSVTGEPLRVWGDFENLSAGPIQCTPNSFFLNKSFMECINTIRDFLGCITFIDESGGLVFRFPNIFTGGNFITDPASTNLSPYLKRRWPIEFHENANLVDYTVQIDDSQVRSEILVVGTNPDKNASEPLAAGIVLGTNAESGTTSAVNFTNVLAGQYRLFMVPGSATELFDTAEQCQRAAELIGLAILRSYRTAQSKITAHPGLQLDDQVRIFERVTNEFNVHYVTGISSRMDLTTGEYMMDVTTNWLGDDPDRDWFIDKVELTPAVKNLPAIIARSGNNPGDGGASYNPSNVVP